MPIVTKMGKKISKLPYTKKGIAKAKKLAKKVKGKVKDSDADKAKKAIDSDTDMRHKKQNMSGLI